MQQTNIPLCEQFDPAELIKLNQEINDFLNAFQTKEWAYCEGDSSYVDCEVATEQAAQKLKKRLTGIAIECGIHADFLNSFTQTYQQNSLLLTTQASVPTDVTSSPTVQ